MTALSSTVVSEESDGAPPLSPGQERQMGCLEPNDHIRLPVDYDQHQTKELSVHLLSLTNEFHAFLFIMT